MAGPLPRSRHLPAALAWLWFVGLALLVAGPLLGGGHLVLLDFPARPEYATLSLVPLPSSGEARNALPVLALYAALRELWEPLPEKLVLLVPIVVGGIGFFRLATRTLGLGALAEFTASRDGLSTPSASQSRADVAEP